MSGRDASGPTIRILAPHYYTLRADSDVGGEVYERMLLERLPAHGIAVVAGLPRDHAVAPAPPGWRVQALRHQLGLHWLAAPAVFTPWLVRTARREPVDLLRGHSVRHTGPSLLLARVLVAKLPGGGRGGRRRIPVVIHHHHFTPRWRRLEAAILRRADAVVTVSELSRSALVAAGVDGDRVHVVYDGVAGPPRTSGWPEAWPGADDGLLKLLTLGRLEARKRPELAIETLALLRAQGVECSLVIAGDGPMLADLVARVRGRGLEHLVRFVGRVSEEQKWQLYDSADVLLFGSTLEGFGLVVAEAQARGVPVVAAAGTATAEALRDGESGFLTDPDARAFAAAVGRLADPAVRRSFGDAARRFAARFDWDRCAAEVAAIYHGVASTMGRRAHP